MSIQKKIRSLKRYQEILTIFVKYGFSEVVNKLGVALLPETAKNLLFSQGTNINALSTHVRVRMAFEELGSTFIKLGQMLSLRPDFLPQEYLSELAKLQDCVECKILSDVKEVILQELNKPYDEIFKEFELTPIASASIGQVHKARLMTGEEVAVKILHQGVEKKIESDIEIMLDIAELVETHIPESQLYNPVGIVNEFGKSIIKELNLVNEGRNMDCFRQYMKDEPTVKTPVVYWDYTTEKVLVTEFINGTKISELQTDSPGINLKQVAVNGAKSLLKQIFEIGFFHADPHPGNIFVLPGNVLVPIDFGNVGRLSEELQDALLDILIGIVEKDVSRIARTLMHIGILEEHLVLRDLERDLMEFLDHYYGIPLNRLNVSKLLNEFMVLIRNHRIKLPPDLILMARALAISEAVGRSLYPDLDMFELVTPFTEKAMLRRLNPFHRYKSLLHTAENTIDLLKDFPENIRSILLKIRNDKLNITFHHKGLEELRHDIDRSSNRLSFSIIIASLIIGSSFIIQLDKGPMLWEYPLIGIVGYIIATVLAVWLLIGIIKSGKL